MFIPLGFLLPVLSRRFQKVGNAVLVCAGTSLTIEILQLFLTRGTDIDDLIFKHIGRTHRISGCHDASGRCQETVRSYRNPGPEDRKDQEQRWKAGIDSCDTHADRGYGYRTVALQTVC